MTPHRDLGGDEMRAVGLVLAAGAGSRFGGPKGLALAADGMPWVALAVTTLRECGCDPVLVAVGARADEVSALVPPGALVVRVDDWAQGLSASVRAGLAASLDADPDAVVIAPVDTPGMPASAVRRLLDAAAASPRTALAQAVYAGRPGHPAVVGGEHIASLAASLSGDRGARPYLAAAGAAEVECGDLWSGADVDHQDAPGGAGGVSRG